MADPATVIEIGHDTHLTKVWLQDTISRFMSDDVWSNEFLKNVVFHHLGEKPVLIQELQATLDSWGTTHVFRKAQ